MRLLARAQVHDGEVAWWLSTSAAVVVVRLGVEVELVGLGFG